VLSTKHKQRFRPKSRRGAPDDSSTRGADGDAGECRNAVIASSDAGARAFSRRSTPRVSKGIVSSASSRGIRARAPRSRASVSRPRARPDARAREKKRAKKPEVSFARETEGTRGWGARAYLAQGAEPLGVDRGLVHEDLLRAVVGGDEPEPLLGVEPLHLRASPAEGRVSYAERRRHHRTIHRLLFRQAIRGEIGRAGVWEARARRFRARFVSCRAASVVPCR